MGPGAAFSSAYFSLSYAWKLNVRVARLNGWRRGVWGRAGSWGELGFLQVSARNSVGSRGQL